jgi:methionine synthase II (cobalamin-independent)
MTLVSYQGELIKTMGNITTTIIGSMPQTTPVDAHRLLEKYPPTIPAWPQLPKRSYKELMIPQYSEGFPGIRVDETDKRIFLKQKDDLVDTMTYFYNAFIEKDLEYFSMSSDFAAGFHYFLDQLGKQNTPLPVIKGQITGPFTFGLGINKENGRAIWFDPQYQDIVIKGLTMKALWQEKRLRPYAKEVIIFCDEPILSALGTPAYLGITDDDVISSLNEIIGELKKYNIVVGSHCCGNTDWGLLTHTYLDIIAFDAYTYGEKVALYPKEINQFLLRGGTLAWGLIPTLNPAALHEITLDRIKTRFMDLLNLFVQKGIKKKLLLQKIMITPACGMGQALEPEESELVLQFLDQLRDRLFS